MTNFADRTIWTEDNLAILRGLNSEAVDLIYWTHCSAPTGTTPPFTPRWWAAPQLEVGAFKDT